MEVAHEIIVFERGHVKQVGQPKDMISYFQPDDNEEDLSFALD